MARIEKTVFISYRRVNFPWALAIYQDLTHRGFDVFFDFTGIASGDFQRVILENIRARVHFLVVLAPDSLERCGSASDFLRLEIETALKEQRNIVPILVDGFDFNSPGIAGQLTAGGLDDLGRYNGLSLPREYFHSAMERLEREYLNVDSSTVLHPLSHQSGDARGASEAAAPSIYAVSGHSHEAAAAQRAPVEKWYVVHPVSGVAQLATSEQKAMAADAPKVDLREALNPEAFAKFLGALVVCAERFTVDDLIAASGLDSNTVRILFAQESHRIELISSAKDGGKSDLYKVKSEHLAELEKQPGALSFPACRIRADLADASRGRKFQGGTNVLSKTKLVYAVEMLHYLPLYIAAQDPELNDKIEIALADPPHGDRQAIDMLMSIADEHSRVDFCVCDPMMVHKDDFRAFGRDEPVVIGQLIGKVPFWAVNHRRKMHSQSEFGRFKEVLGYPSPNTGYFLGELVCAPFKGNGFDTKFVPSKQIDDDLESSLNGFDNRVVIEADILKIRKFIQKMGNEIVYSFAEDAAYSPFCFTAIISHRRFLDTKEGSDLSVALLKAICRANELIYSFPEHAASRVFPRFRAKYSFDEIKGAVNMLIQEKIFSYNPRVTRKAWNKSGRLRTQVQAGFESPAFESYVENRIAKAAFKQHRQSRSRIGDDPRNVVPIRALISYGSLLLILASVFFLMPFAIAHFAQKPLSPLRNLWLLLNIGLTSVVASIYWFKARICQRFKIEPERVLEFWIGILIAYASAWVGLVTELLKQAT